MVDVETLRGEVGEFVDLALRVAVAAEHGPECHEGDEDSPAHCGCAISRLAAKASDLRALLSTRDDDPAPDEALARVNAWANDDPYLYANGQPGALDKP